MCGIAGLITRQPTAPANPSLVQRMTQCLSHRGPDADGIWHEESIALGHRRLSIIDLTDGANQPLPDHTGRYVITFNGEIYNYQAIRQQLADYPFRTQSDTEVILAAYERWGTDCLRHFNGMFAFAIWDRQTRQLFAARDRLGKKPFYYFLNNQYLLFASEVRALLKTDLVPRTLNPAALNTYLMYQTVPEPDTLVAGVRQLPAGHYALFANNQWTETRYWDLFTPPPVDPALIQNAGTIQQQVHTLLRGAVGSRMVSDVPLGAFLSGGIDSSAVVALMAEQSEQPVNTFTVTFGEVAFNESAYAQAIAKRFNTRHTELPLSADRLLHELPTILASMDQPSGDGPNTYMVAEMTKQAGITVALSGLGGDEVFAGYSTFGRYARLRQLAWLWYLPTGIRKQLLSSLSPGRNKAKINELAALTSLNPAGLFPLFRQSMPASGVAELVGKSAATTTPFEALFRQRQASLALLPPQSQLTISELTTYTQPLLLRDADQMSMAHALELRVPLLDYTLIEFMLRVPDRYKNTAAPKQLLVDSLVPLLPQTLLQRPKMGFSFPWEQWMRHELRTFCSDRLHNLGQRGLIDSSILSQSHSQFLQGHPDVTWNHIWLLVVLEDWLDANDF